MSSKQSVRRRRLVLFSLALVLMAAVAVWVLVADRPFTVPSTSVTADWPHYGGDLGGRRYSPLDQITPANVHGLEIAWEYHTGDVQREGTGPTAWENTPILVEDTLFLCTPFNRVIALDPETGAERWTFDPQLDLSVRYANQFVCRGVAYWRDGEVDTAGPCSSRILTATNDARLIALDARTGAPCTEFGNNGEVLLRKGIGELRWPGEYQMTSPPQVIGDRVVVGSAVGDNVRVDAPSGVVRAYDVRSGELDWAWNVAPEPGERTTDAGTASPAAGTAEREEVAATEEPLEFLAGTPNAWAPLSADAERGLVFVPTGNPSPDYWAAHRGSLDDYGSSVVALDAGTGEVVWSLKTVRLDLWDFDVPAQPTLFTMRRDGEEIPAVVQATKMGFLFFAHRETGEPLFEIEERPVPQTDVPGEVTSPTQPFPTLPPPLVPNQLSAEQAWGFTPIDRGACRERLAQLRFEGMYTPPSLEGTLMYPGNAGGSNWGGVAVDERRGIVIANTMDLPWAVQLFEEEQLEEMRARFPDAELSRQEGTPYWLMREMLVSPFGVPCNPPPWGTLAAINAERGEILWQVPLGTVRDLVPGPWGPKLGVPNLGGPVVTASGLIFIAATVDDYLRAFDTITGEELWKGRLPGGGQATPMTYRLRPDGRQFVVIAAGGHARGGSTLGDSLVAFALPQQ